MLKDINLQIKPLNLAAMEKCQIRIDNLTKPLNSLNSFEYLARKIAGITANPRPKFLKKSIIVTRSKTTHSNEYSPVVTSFADHVAADVVFWDVESIHTSKYRSAGRQITQPTRGQVIAAIEHGISLARKTVADGAQIIGLGDLGSEIRCSENLIPALIGEGHDPLEALCTTGNLAIAGLAGVIIGSAAAGAAVVLDGPVTSAAALTAVSIAPNAKEYIIGSHFSVDPFHKVAMEALEIPAYLHLDLNLGDGTGAALGISLINASLHMLNDMKTFGEAEVAVAQDGPGALRQSKDIKD